jgi:hypothetical protein
VLPEFATINFWKQNNPSGSKVMTPALPKHKRFRGRPGVRVRHFVRSILHVVFCHSTEIVPHQLGAKRPRTSSGNKVASFYVQCKLPRVVA